MSVLTLIQAAQTIDANPLWEIAKGVMLTLCTAMLTMSGRMLFSLRDDVRDLKHELIGRDGTNGIKSQVRLHSRRIDAIEDRNIALDAVAEAEKHQHAGPDRRVGPRRTRDVVHEAIDERLRRITDEHPTEDSE